MAERRESQTSLKQLALLFFKLGVISFGGPAAHIAMMEDEVVRRRRWLSRDEFLDLLGATNLIPGPNSTEMAIHIGRRRTGWPGLLVAWSRFIFPATLIVTALARAYVRYGSLTLPVLRRRSIDLNREGRAFVPSDFGKEIEYAFGPSILAIQQLIGPARFRLAEPPGRGGNPIAFEIAAHIARGDAHARIVTNPFDLVRMGHGVEIQRAAIFDEPEWRAHSLSVPAIALQVQILSVGELGELVIAHNFTKPFCSTCRLRPPYLTDFTKCF